MDTTDAVMTDAEREALGRALTQSPFMHLRGGAGFGCISWLLAGGLLTVVLGSTWNQAEPNRPLVNWPLVASGWVAVVIAVCVAGVYLSRLARFFRGVRAWSTAEVTRRARIFTPPSPLETTLSTLSVQQGTGPGVTWALGATLMPPCGLVAAPLCLVVIGIIVSDWRSGQTTLSGLQQVELAGATVGSLVVSSIFVVVLVGFQKAGMRLRRMHAEH